MEENMEEVRNIPSTFEMSQSQSPPLSPPPGWEKPSSRSPPPPPPTDLNSADHSSPQEHQHRSPLNPCTASRLQSVVENAEQPVRSSDEVENVETCCSQRQECSNSPAPFEDEKSKAAELGEKVKVERMTSAGEEERRDGERDPRRSRSPSAENPTGCQPCARSEDASCGSGSPRREMETHVSTRIEKETPETSSIREASRKKMRTSPPQLPEMLPPPIQAMGQMTCGSCDKLLSYPKAAVLVKCPCCQTVNFVLEEHQVGNVTCGRCSILLMYPYGAPSVRCSCCRFVTEIGAQNRRPPLSVQQGRPPPASTPC